MVTFFGNMFFKIVIIFWSYLWALVIQRNHLNTNLSYWYRNNNVLQTRSWTIYKYHICVNVKGLGIRWAPYYSSSAWPLTITIFQILINGKRGAPRILYFLWNPKNVKTVSCQESFSNLIRGWQWVSERISYIITWNLFEM